MESLRLFETRFEVVPCRNGGFLVVVCDGARMWTDKQYAFTNVTDLMRFLHQQDPRTNQPVNQVAVPGAGAPTYNQQAELKQRLLDKHGAQRTPLALPLPNGDAKAKSWPWR